MLLFLIDFDRMICEDEQKVTENTTKDLGSLFYHPTEITDGTIKEYTFEEDDYSLEKLVEFIFSDENYQINQSIFQFAESFDVKSSLESIFNDCKNEAAQNKLGLIYYEGKYISRDMNKAIHYLILVANQNIAEAHFVVGLIYLLDHNNVKEGAYNLEMASMHRYKWAHYFIGFLYYEWKYVKQDIENAIHYYKDASSFDDNHAKNNLGVIYKNGFNDEIPSKLGLAIDYFEEAIRQKNDKLSMFNLSSIFMYDERIKIDLNKSIELLIKSSNLNFELSCTLLCLAIIKSISMKI